MELRKEWDLATNRQFSERVSMGLYHVARTILDENPSTYGHLIRRNGASIIIQSSSESLVRYSAIVITDPVIAGKFITSPNTNNNNISDQEIINAITNMWNAINNVPPPETSQ